MDVGGYDIQRGGSGVGVPPASRMTACVGADDVEFLELGMTKLPDGLPRTKETRRLLSERGWPLVAGSTGEFRSDARQTISFPLNKGGLN